MPDILLFPFLIFFQPDMEFLQGLLKKVPIHCLPAWHAVPRTSNNIFESLVEKYLLSPQIFQRYLSELHFSHPVAISLMNDLFFASSPARKGRKTSRLAISSSREVYARVSGDTQKILPLAALS